MLPSLSRLLLVPEAEEPETASLLLPDRITAALLARVVAVIALIGESNLGPGHVPLPPCTIRPANPPRAARSDADEAPGRDHAQRAWP